MSTCGTTWRTSWPTPMNCDRRLETSEPTNGSSREGKRMTRFFAIGRTIGVVAVLSVSVLAAADTGTVRGVVVVAGGGPVVGADVVISSSADSRYTATARTDQEGRFAFADAPVGGIEVKVYDSNEHLLATSAAAIQKPGETITITVEVKPAP